MKHRKAWVMLTAVVALGVLSTVCLAAEEAVKPAGAKGEIVSVDLMAGSLTVKESNPAPVAEAVSQPVSFVVDSKTVISKEKQTLMLGDLKAGDLVTVEYSVTPDNKSLASSVTVETKTAPTAAP